MTRARDGEDGFTLIEALVAMAVLATGAVGLLIAVERHAAMARQLGDRTVARWVAEDRLAEVALGLPGGEGVVEAMGIAWRVATDVSPTADPDLVRVDVSVATPDPGVADAPLVRMTGFFDAAAMPAGVLP